MLPQWHAGCWVLLRILHNQGRALPLRVCCSLCVKLSECSSCVKLYSQDSSGSYLNCHTSCRVCLRVRQ